MSLLTTGQFIYTPNASFIGTDTFRYQVTDGQRTEAATVTITVDPANRAPVAASDSYSTSEDTGLSVPVAQGVLANDSDQM